MRKTSQHKDSSMSMGDVRMGDGGGGDLGGDLNDDRGSLGIPGEGI